MSPYQIDQSGKIEQSNKPTILCLANGKHFTIKISAVEKQKAIKALLKLRHPHKTYIYDIFSALAYILLRSKSVRTVEIDIEYPGHQAGIKERLIQYFGNQKTPDIHFGLVGKNCNAHKMALNVFHRNTKPDNIITAERVLKVIYSTKKGWRSRSSRENP